MSTLAGCLLVYIGLIFVCAALGRIARAIKKLADSKKEKKETE